MAVRHNITGQALWIVWDVPVVNELHVLGVETGQSPENSSDPDVTGWILGNRFHLVPYFVWHKLLLLTIITRQPPIVASDPHHSLSIFEDRPDSCHAPCC